MRAPSNIRNDTRTGRTLTAVEIFVVERNHVCRGGGTSALFGVVLLLLLLLAFVLIFVIIMRGMFTAEMAYFFQPQRITLVWHMCINPNL